MKNEYGLILKRELLTARDGLNEAIKQIDDDGCVVFCNQDEFRLYIANALRHASAVLYLALPDPEYDDEEDEETKK